MFKVPHKKMTVPFANFHTKTMKLYISIALSLFQIYTSPDTPQNSMYSFEDFHNLSRFICVPLYMNQMQTSSFMSFPSCNAKEADVLEIAFC